MRKVLVVALLLASCTHDTPQQALAKQLRPAKSWAASLAFIGEAWLANSVPSRFVADSVSAARDELSTDRDSVRDAAAQHALDDAARAATELGIGVGANNRREVSDAIARCHAAARSLAHFTGGPS